MSTPTTTSTIQNNKLFNVEFKHEPPKALSLKISTACAGSVTRNASSIRVPATQTIRSGFVHDERHRIALGRGTLRSTKKSCSFFRPSEPERPEPVAGTTVSDRHVRRRGQPARAATGDCRLALLEPADSPLRGDRFGRNARSRSPASDLSWNRQRIAGKGSDPSAVDRRAQSRRRAYLLRRRLCRCVPRADPAIERGRSVADRQHAERGCNVLERDRPAARSSFIARQSTNGARPAAQRGHGLRSEVASNRTFAPARQLARGALRLRRGELSASTASLARQVGLVSEHVDDRAG